MPRELQPCGTRAAYERHRRKGEPIDEACREANRRSMAAWRESVVEMPVSAIPHGINGYVNYACRCAVCEAAGSARNRAYRESVKSRSAAAP